MAVPSQASCEQGKFFCFLEIPSKYNIKFHVNSFFELNRSRRDIWLASDTLVGEEKTRFEWNKLILKRLIPPCLVNLNNKLVSQRQMNRFDMWPLGLDSKIKHLEINFFEYFSKTGLLFAEG